MKVSGYVGKILWVELGTGSFSTLNTMDYADYIGGKGIATKLQWDLGKPEVKDGFDPESLLMFMTGPLAGTPAPSSGRMAVCFKQATQWPKTYFSHSGAGGYFAPELKFAGYDGIVFQGASPRPVYLWINDGKVELKDATPYWSMDTYQAQEYIRKELGGDPKIRMAVIGPAGKNQARASAILFDLAHAAGQGGGGVMGSKNLKAIAVRGTGGIKIANPKALLEIRLRYMNMVNAESGKGYIRTFFSQLYGHLGYQSQYGCFACPANCYQYLRPSRSPRGGNVCGWCDEYARTTQIYKGISHHEKTKFGDLYVEPMFDFQNIDDTVRMFSKTFDLEGISGFDLLGFAGPGPWIHYMCYDEVFGGVFKDLLEKEVGEDFGSRGFAEKITGFIAEREGKTGELLSKGICRAARYLKDYPEEFGLTKAQGEYAWQCYERLYPTNYAFEHHFYRPSISHFLYSWKDIMQAPICQMIQAIGTRDEMSSHHSTTRIYDDNRHGASREHALVAWGIEEAACRYLDAKGNPVLKNQRNFLESEKYYTLDGKESIPVKANWTKGTPQAAKIMLAMGLQSQSLLLCDWLFPMIAGGFLPFEAFQMNENASDPGKSTDMNFGGQFFSAVTGIKKSFEELNEDSYRCLILERAVHVRDNDRNRGDDRFSEIFYDRPDCNGIPIDRDEFNNGMSMLYELMGFDVRTGCPTRATLEKYGLEDVADQLKALGKLSG